MENHHQYIQVILLTFQGSKFWDWKTKLGHTTLNLISNFHECVDGSPKFYDLCRKRRQIESLHERLNHFMKDWITSWISFWFIISYRNFNTPLLHSDTRMRSFSTSTRSLTWDSITDLFWRVSGWWRRQRCEWEGWREKSLGCFAPPLFRFLWIVCYSSYQCSYSVIIIWSWQKNKTNFISFKKNI